MSDTDSLFFVLFQDKNVAFKIFELGLKKYGEFPEYVKSYVDFMSHVNGKFSVLRAVSFIFI